MQLPAKDGWGPKTMAWWLCNSSEAIYSHIQFVRQSIPAAGSRNMISTRLSIVLTRYGIAQTLIEALMCRCVPSLPPFLIFRADIF
jgi:hypothetical protein